jgi:acetyl esterase/lipase
MGRTGKRVATILAILAALVLATWGVLALALARNAPAVVDLVDRTTGGAREVAIVESTRFGDHPAHKIAVYRVGGEPASPLPVIVFYHGGGWHSGDPDDYGFVARGLAPEGFLVVLAGYRLRPEGIYPAMLEDSAAAFAWARANVARLGGDPERMFVAGHSAGAYNAAMLALDGRWLGRHDLAPDAIAGVIGLAGPYDFYPFDKESSRATFGHWQNPRETQPVRHVSADTPPMLLLHGEEDTVVRPRNSRALAAALESVGAQVEARFYPGMDHNDPLLGMVSPWRRNRQVLDPIVAFVRDAERRASFPVQAEMR